MTRHIIVAITPDADGVRCGECIGMQPEYPCDPQPSPLPEADGSDTYRGPECLAAERKLAALIEAGESIARCLPREPVVVVGPTANLAEAMSRVIWDKVKAWDRAVAEVK